MKKFMAILLSMIMMLSLSVVGFSASAADSNSNASSGYSISESVTVDGFEISFYSIMNLSSNGVSAPNVTYTYNLYSDDAGYYDSSSSYFYTAGVATDPDVFDEETFSYMQAGILPASSESIESTVKFTTNDYANEYYYVDKTVSLDLSDVDFDDVGVYHYYLVETTDDVVPSLGNEYYDTRDVFVTVSYADDGESFEISNVVMYQAYGQGVMSGYDQSGVVDSYIYNSLAVDKNGGYYHSYGMGSNTFEQANQTPGGNLSLLGTILPLSYDSFDEIELTDMMIVRRNYVEGVYEAGLYGQDLIITNTAFGDMASRDKEFTFTVSSENVDNGAVFEVVDADGTSRYIVQTEQGFYFASYDETSGLYNSNGTPFTFTLSDGEEYAILSVVEEMTFKVVISDSNYEGYSYYARDYYDTEYDEYSSSEDASSGDTDMNEELSGLFEKPELSLLSIFNVSSVTDTTEEDTTEGSTTTERRWTSITSSYEITIDEYYAYSDYELGSMLAQKNTLPQNFSSENSYSILDLTAYNVEVDTYEDDAYYVDVLYTQNDGIDFAIVKGQYMGQLDDTDIIYDDEIPATGLTIDYIPFILMVLAAGIYMVSQMLDKRKQAKGMA